jgi:hypothetical protein
LRRVVSSAGGAAEVAGVRRKRTRTIAVFGVGMAGLRKCGENVPRRRRGAKEAKGT